MDFTRIQAILNVLFVILLVLLVIQMEIHVILAFLDISMIQLKHLQNVSNVQLHV